MKARIAKDAYRILLLADEGHKGLSTSSKLLRNRIPKKIRILHKGEQYIVSSQFPKEKLLSK